MVFVLRASIVAAINHNAHQNACSNTLAKILGMMVVTEEFVKTGDIIIIRIFIIGIQELGRGSYFIC